MSQNVIDKVSELVEKIDTDRRLSKEVLTKLPEVVKGDENTDVTFHIEPDVVIPSLKKMVRLFESGQGLININKRIAHAEQQLVNVIGEATRISQSLGVNRLNPSWTAMDLMASNSDGDTGNPLYSASVDGGLRFAPEADHQRRPSPKISDSVSKIGAWMTAKYTERVISKARKYNGSGESYTLSRNLYDFLAKNRSSLTVVEKRLVTRSYTTTETRVEKYGGYYQWQTQYIYNQTHNTRDIHQKRVYVDGERQVSYQRTHYYQTWENFKKVIPTMTEPQTKSFNGDYVCIGQTFYLPENQVVTGFEYWEYQPQTNTADRKYLLCRCQNGSPLLTDVIAEGSVSFSGNSYTEKMTVKWDKPVVLNAKEQVALVILFDKPIFIYNTYSYYDDDRTGQLMFTRDGYLWDKLTFGIYGGSSTSNIVASTSDSSRVALDDSQDLAYNIIVASFPNEREEIIMPNFDLVGGISTASINLTAQMPLDNSVGVEVMVKINNEWQPLSVLNKNINLPPSTEAKLVLTGTSNVMPIIDTENTEFTLFRPKSSLTYVTKERQRPTDNIIKVAMEVAGYDNRYHTVDCVLLVGDRNEEVRPTVTVSGTSSDSSTGTRRFEFRLPAGRDNYRIKVSASTSNASFGFDISSLIEFH